MATAIVSNTGSPEKWHKVILVLACQVELPRSLTDHIAVALMHQIQASQCEMRQVKAHVPEDRSGMEIELQEILCSDPRRSTAKFQLQSTADLWHTGCWVQQLPERVDEAIVLHAACLSSNSCCQYVVRVHLPHVWPSTP